MRRVRTLRLSAGSQQLVRRGQLLVEDALRTASLPDADTARLYVVRSLDIGRVAALGPPSRVALAIERSFSSLRVSAVHALDASATSARTVYFADAVEAHVELAVRLARSLPVHEWFWHLAVPAFEPQQSRDDALRNVLFSALNTPPGAVAAVEMVQALQRHDVTDALLDTLRWQDGSALLRASDLSASFAAPLYAPTSTPQRQLALVERWSARWSPTDARTVWLASVVLALDKPLRILEPGHAALARTFAAELHAPPPSGGNATAPASMPYGAPPSRLVTPPVSPATRGRVSVSRPSDTAVTSRIEPSNSGVGLPPGASSLDTGVAPASANSTTAAPRPSSSSSGVPSNPEVGFVTAAAERRRSRDASSTDADAPGESDSIPSSVGDVVPGEPIPTDYAGLYFVLRLLQRLHIEQAPGVIELDLAAHILRQLATRLHIPDDDPILQPLPELDDHAAADQLAYDWLRQARLLCRRTCRMGLSELVRKRGRIAFTRTHLDLFFDLNAIDIRLRRGGLDVDPGWLPWFGRVVLFHYGEAGA